MSIDSKNDSDFEASDMADIQKLPLTNQNFGLTKLEFESVVIQLKLGDESIFERIFLAHFRDCVIYLQKTYKAAHDIAYDITMDALIEFRHKILTDKISYGNLRFLFTKIASQIYLKSKEKENRLKDLFLESNTEEDDFDDKILALKNAWRDLSVEDKKLLEDFYYLDIPLNKIAETENKSDAALRKQKQRAVDKLRTSFFTIYTNQ